MLNLQEEGLPLLNGQKLPRFLWNSLLQQAACFAPGFYAAWSVLQKKCGVMLGAVWSPGRFIPIPCYPPQVRCGCRRKDAEHCCCSAGHCRLTVSQLPKSPDPFPSPPFILSWGSAKTSPTASLPGSDSSFLSWERGTKSGGVEVLCNSRNDSLSCFKRRRWRRSSAALTPAGWHSDGRAPEVMRCYGSPRILPPSPSSSSSTYHICHDTTPKSFWVAKEKSLWLWLCSVCMDLSQARNLPFKDKFLFITKEPGNLWQRTVRLTGQVLSLLPRAVFSSVPHLVIANSYSIPPAACETIMKSQGS